MVQNRLSYLQPSRPRLAIVEDDLAIISLLCELFDELGWVVMPCPQGRPALTMLQSGRPDVILLDIRMDTPDRGWCVLREIRRTAWGRQKPIVICSCAPVVAEWPIGLTGDRIQIVKKPFELDELISVVARCLEAARLLPYRA